MAVSDPTVSSFSAPSIGSIPGPIVIPVSVMGDWVTVNSDPATADNAGSAVLEPRAITRAAIIPLLIAGHGTSVLVRMAYDSADEPTTDPVVQVFGFDANNAPMRLKTAAGTHELTCVETLASDAQYDDGTTVWAYTSEHELDCKGCKEIWVVVKTASAGSTGGLEVIQAKII